MTRRLHLVTASVALTLGLAQDATAATIATTRTCLNSEAPAQFVATGFTPGAQVKISIRGIIVTMGLAGPDGRLDAQFKAPPANPLEPTAPFGFEATDGTNVASGSALLATPGPALPTVGRTRVQMRYRSVYVQFDQSRRPVLDQSPRGFARYFVTKGFRNNPEIYRRYAIGWRERTRP